jgi:hypothetical protein
LSQCIPLVFANLVLCNIVNFGDYEQQNGQHVDANEHSISAMIQWLIVGSVDVCANDTTKLNAHLFPVRLSICRFIVYLLLYNAAETLRDPTLLEFLEIHPLFARQIEH